METVKSQALEKQISGFRDEVLQIKSDKNKLISKLKASEIEAVNSKIELKDLKVKHFESKVYRQ